MNLFANRPNAVIATQTVSFAAIGFDVNNISIVYELGNSLMSWKPNREINPITGTIASRGYYIIPKIDMDIPLYFIPPVPGDQDTGIVYASWFGCVPDYNLTTHTGTDNAPMIQAGIDFMINNGGQVFKFGAGHFYSKTGLFANTNSQIPITIMGTGENLSYSDADANVKGTVIHLDEAGDWLRIGLDEDGNRFYTSPSFLYKAFALKNMSFIGENVTLGINVIRAFFCRLYVENVSATKLDYLVLESDTDASGNDNYCDGSYFKNVKVYQSRYGGIRLVRSDIAIIEQYVQETGTTTTARGIEIKGASAVALRGLIFGGNASVPPFLSGSTLIDIDNCKNVHLGQLHIEHCFMENAIYIKNSTQNVHVEGLYMKFESKNVFKFSGLVETVSINNWFSFGTGPSSGYADLNAVNLSTDDITITGLNLRDGSLAVRDLIKLGAAINTTQANKNNLLTKERFILPQATNELVRGLAYNKGQTTLTGGGTITFYVVSGTPYLKWTTRFLASSIDKINGPSGFIDIAMPASGTVIAGLGTTPSVTVTSDGIPFGATWNTLLVEHTTGAVGSTITLKVAVFGTQGTNTVLSNQIVIAQRNNDNTAIRIGSGFSLKQGGAISNDRQLIQNGVQLVPNVDATISIDADVIILNKGNIVSGANRTLTWNSAAATTGRKRQIINYNTGSFFYSSTVGFLTAAGTITQIPNKSVIEIISDGTDILVSNTWAIP